MALLPQGLDYNDTNTHNSQLAQNATVIITSDKGGGTSFCLRLFVCLSVC